MRPALDSAGHRVPRTKPTCLLHTWRPHRRRPFSLVLHQHQHQSSRNVVNHSSHQEETINRSSNHTWSSTGPGRPAWAGWPRPIPAWFGRPFAPVGPHAFMHFAPSTCTILTMSSSRPRWRFSVHEFWSFTFQSLGMFLRSTSVIATIGSDFFKLMYTNKTP
jgi:hypothetical protein